MWKHLNAVERRKPFAKYVRPVFGWFGELAAAAAQPITDHRSTAEYRRHAVQVIATRALERSLAS